MLRKVYYSLDLYKRLTSISVICPLRFFVSNVSPESKLVINDIQETNTFLGNYPVELPLEELFIIKNLLIYYLVGTFRRKRNVKKKDSYQR